VRGHIEDSTAVTARGFTLVEVLLASMLFLLVGGVVATLTPAARDAVARTVAQEEITGGARAALEMVASEVRQAGAASALHGPTRLGTLTPTVTILVSLDDGTEVQQGQAVRLVGVVRGVAQAMLEGAAWSGDSTVQLDGSACTATGAACGFVPGTRIVLADETTAAFATVTAATKLNVLAFTPPLPAALSVGANVAAVERVSYGVRQESDGSSTLVRISTGGAEQPVLRNVVDFELTRSSGSRVDIRLRVEAAAATLRGPQGALFRRAGSAVHASRWVPDLDLLAAVSLRNAAP
jgi:type II secretory pathway pseudopilin PulG